MPMLAIAIGMGLAVSLVFTELFGLAAGGMVVPGYFAMFLNHPWTVMLTLGVALVTFLLVRTLASVMIIFGRRRTVMMILIGYLLGAVVRMFQGTLTVETPADVQVIGYIVPGLIAIWIDRQGMMETLAALLTASVVVRLLLIIFLGAELSP